MPSEPRVAVLSLTRDRLDYTKVCFQSLRDNAGCDYDHFVLDQGSEDGTFDWLYSTYKPYHLHVFAENAGYAAGMNELVEQATLFNEYDLLVTFDNDCNVLTPGTLRVVVEETLAADRPAFISPLILGLRHRPPIIQTIGRIGKAAVVGGIFRSIPPQVLKAGFRFNEAGSLCGDEQPVIDAVRDHNGWCGYLLTHQAEHYRTTDGQHEDYPEYFRRRREDEGGPD